MSSNFYRAFEDKYRGSRDLIKSRLEVYLPFIEKIKKTQTKLKAIDLGCGRGEWLELLNENGYEAEGIDLDEGMLEACRQRGFDVKRQDVIESLQNLDENSISIISGFHIVEHLPFEVLQTLVQESLRVLAPGGLLILETPNPENIKVATENFYRDPTHIRPIPSELLSFLPEHYEFERTKVLRLQESKEFYSIKDVSLSDVIDGASPDYAIIAQKKANYELLNQFDELFTKEYGLPLKSLMSRFEDRLLTIEQNAAQAEQRATQAEQNTAQAEQNAAQAEQNAAQAEQNAAQAVQYTELILNSNSWKITQPLRSISSFLRWFGRGAYSWITLAPGSRPRRVVEKIKALLEEKKKNKSKEVYGCILTKNKPSILIDMYVLGQGVRTGVFRVCDEIYKRLITLEEFNTNYYISGIHAEKTRQFIKNSNYPCYEQSYCFDDVKNKINFFLAPFGVAPTKIISKQNIKHIQIVHDLIAIHNPEYFSTEGVVEVKNIIDSLSVSTIIFVNSENTKKDLLEYRKDLNSKQITVIPLAADSRFFPCLDEKKKKAVCIKYNIPETPYVLSLATLEIRKNMEMVVEAFSRFILNNPHYSHNLVLSGMTGWKLQKLQEKLKNRPEIKGRVILTGFVDDEDLPTLYSGAECFVYLSRYEGFGLPPLEAMACGTPVITSDNSSLPEVVGDAGRIFNCDDFLSVAKEMQKIASDSAYRKKLCEKGINQSKKFNWDIAVSIISQRLKKELDAE